MHITLKRIGAALTAAALLGGLAGLGSIDAGAADLISAPPTEFAPSGTVTANQPGRIVAFNGDLYATQSTPGFVKITSAGALSNLTTDTGGAYAVVKTSANAFGQLFWVEGTNLRSYAINGTGTTYVPAVAATAASLLEVNGQLWIGRTGGVDRYTVSGSALGPAGTIALGATGTGRMALGADGNVWIVETDLAALGIDKVTRWTQAGGQIGATYLISNAAADPTSIAKGTDGVMSIAAPGVDKILRMTTDGANNPALVTEVAVPGAGPQTVVAGPDNAVWFTQKNANSIGRIADGAGAATTIGGLSTGFGPQGIVPLAPDNNMWVTGVNGNRVAKFGTAPVPTTTTSTVAPTTTVAATTAPTTIAVAIPTTAATTLPTIAVSTPPVSIVITRTCIKSRTVTARVNKKRVKRTTCLRYRTTAAH